MRGSVFRSRHICRLGLAVGMVFAEKFCLGGAQVRLKSIEHGHRHLGTPGVHLFLFPVTIQTDGGVSEIFRKAQPVATFTNQSVTELTAGVSSVDTSTGALFTIGKDQEDLALLGIIRADRK